MRFVVSLLAGWFVALVTTAVLLVVATGLLHVVGAASKGSLVGRPQILVAVAVVLLLGSFAGGLTGVRYLKQASRTGFGLLVGVLLLVTTVVAIVGTGIRGGGDLIADPVGYLAVPLAAALVGGLVGVALAKPAASK
jgi:hypothetical protein